MKRLDIAAAERSELRINSRTQARELIKQGKLTVEGKVIIKPSELVSDNAVMLLSDGPPKYVGRGGYKLETAIEVFGIKLNDCVCLDIGASTGGFTDCMLQNGAIKIYAVDVGKGQLHEKLKNDNRVISLEGLNIRDAGEKEIIEKADFIGIDVSFISLRLIIPVLERFLKSSGSVSALIKPQFEVGKKHFKNGIIKDKKEHDRVVGEITEFTQSQGYNVVGVTKSKITGGDGNMEYIIYFKK